PGPDGVRHNEHPTRQRPRRDRKRKVNGMSITATVAKAGLVRGRSELRHTFTNFQDLWGYIFPAVVLLVVMLLQRNSTVGPGGFSLGASTLPGAIGMGIAFAGLMSVAGQLI